MLHVCTPLYTYTWVSQQTHIDTNAQWLPISHSSNQLLKSNDCQETRLYRTLLVTTPTGPFKMGPHLGSPQMTPMVGAVTCGSYTRGAWNWACKGHMWAAHSMHFPVCTFQYALSSMHFPDTFYFGEKKESYSYLSHDHRFVWSQLGHAKVCELVCPH